MIPTSVTNSPPAAGLAQNGAAAVVVVVGGGSSAAAAAAAASTAAVAAQQQSNYNSIVLGLASLILEGRPIADDEYPLQLQLHAQHQLQQQQQQLPQLQQQQQLASSSSSGRHSPRPSTSRAAINITTNPYALTSPTLRSVYGHAYAHAPAHSHGHGQAYHSQGYGYDYRQGGTSGSSSSSSTSATHQRWTQKLCQLRQLSPAAQSMTVEPELVSLAINELNTERGDFEIVRRVMFNNHLTATAAAGGGGGGSTGIESGGATGSSSGAQLLAVASSSNSSAASSPGGSVSSSDNILHSLQSLATTCLRGGGGGPNTASSSEARPLSLDIAAAAAAATTVSQTASRLSDYNCSRTTLGARGGVGEGVAVGLAMSGGGGVYSGGVGVGVGGGAATSTATASNNIATGTGNGNGNATATATNSSCNTRPKHGPHCDQFLRKMGLAKGESADAEEHFCDMSYVNITCSRWRAHCMKMEAILARREPVCIEVFLGPAGHKILLEQWIISGKEKVPPPTMTLPSLCSAIRSQLYFSQIVAWCDLLRKCDPSVYDSGRVIFANGSSTTAGDLAGHSGGSNSNSTMTSSAAAAAAATAASARRPRLNIFYRIRPYDPTNSTNGNHTDGGFSAKATVHNFPHVNIAENFSVAVCVKSLPRFNGGLPHIAPPTGRRAPPPPPPASATSSRKSRPAASTPTGGGGMCAATPTGLGARIALLSTTPPGTSSSSSCDKYDRRRRNEEELQLQLQLEQDLDADTGGPTDELGIGHRERQLQKYRKRMQRRDKKRERKPSDDPLEEQMDAAMDEGNDEDAAAAKQLPSPTAAAATAAAVLIPTLMSPPRRIAMISTGTQTSLSSCQKCGCEKTLLCLNCTADEDEDADADADGNGDDTSASEMEETSISSSSCSLSSSDLIVGTPRNKAELLLQAIQRTPKNRKPNPKAAAHNDLKAGGLLQTPPTPTPSQQHQQQQQQQSPKPAAPTSGCQMCKRQKTQHTFASGKKSGGAVAAAAAVVAVKAVARQESSSTTNGTNGHSNSAATDNGDAGDDNSMDQEVEQTASTKLTPNIDRCTLNADRERCQTPPDVGACAMDDERIVVQFKTPISHVPLKQQDYQQQQHQSHSQQQQSQHQQQQQVGQQLCKASSQLRLNCNGIMLDRETPSPMLSPLMRKALPKVNLNTIFCSSSSGGSSGNSPSTSSSSAPISIDSGLAFSFEQPTLSYGHTQSQSQSLLTPPDCHQSSSNLHVQKSYSAPTLPNALSVSPRFAKQAAFYKRRSRHLSDRSDRSSLGSDEQLSDEDLESGMCSPAGSPLKTRARLATQFGGRPLLGNLEESLLQKRLLPKIEVAGFRLQLGASGVFCPKQRTISASSYFYELHGETLSTPYLCEIRLPRKGYSVPLMGTVQATLLNPMGTVVRMFVIPYDMRDMPNLHRTFIRQRILADELPCNSVIIMQPQQQQPVREREREPGSPTAMSTTSKLGHFISAEQMKRLRYSIHLRFQTSRSGRLSLHTDIRLLISRRTDCDTAAAHAKGLVEAPNELVTDTLMPTEPRYSARQESPGKI
ncbi:uncharacterized protein LOC6560854 [Drosophila grimshawi]|uniref:GH20495 n=1 Tax=Drosophila grimshawi TaxID=7222 RepID=B4J909_DROGR|nr:uncharacterized protein LOC6560854 [Drosophila grimshawi]EDW01358.1 GH20495 [Drosophila grimshawi]